MRKATVQVTGEAKLHELPTKFHKNWTSYLEVPAMTCKKHTDPKKLFHFFSK
jgi:hypothetical protein